MALPLTVVGWPRDACAFTYKGRRQTWHRISPACMWLYTTPCCGTVLQVLVFSGKSACISTPACVFGGCCILLCCSRSTYLICPCIATIPAVLLRLSDCHMPTPTHVQAGTRAPTGRCGAGPGAVRGPARPAAYTTHNGTPVAQPWAQLGHLGGRARRLHHVLPPGEGLLVAQLACLPVCVLSACVLCHVDRSSPLLACPCLR
jgi:hypothetical protein